ncbi:MULTISPECIES: hypothetical protein [Streptomyces]
MVPSQSITSASYRAKSKVIRLSYPSDHTHDTVVRTRSPVTAAPGTAE